MHALQANIIISSAAQEVANLKRRWERFDPSIIIDECQSLYLIHPPPAIGPQRATSSQSLPLSTPMHNSLSELASPASQGQDPPFLSPALHMLPLPNLEVANVRSSPAASSGNSNKTPTDNSNAERLIAFKDREILLLRSELQHELYLKSQHVQQMGTLHRQKVLDSGYEADRQAMMNQVKYYRGQLSERQTQIDKQRAEASTARQAHVKWEGELRGKNRALKDERRAWRLERDGLKAQIETMQVREYTRIASAEIDPVSVRRLSWRRKPALWMILAQRTLI